MNPIAFIHDFDLDTARCDVVERLKMSLLDLIGIAIGAEHIPLSAIIQHHARQEFQGTLPLLFAKGTVSSTGFALAAGMRIDALDGHDGFNPSKGHVGCSLFAATLPVAIDTKASGKQFLSALLMGYEFGARAAMAQHGTVADFHTSGSWGAVMCAATCSRLMGLDYEQTRHALGIAEYHGPRSQMMRCIDDPTMVKDGSGWGAMAGVSASKLAKAGFTGAPAITVEQAPEYWRDLGQRWYMLEQYYKPYPVCRWAQAPVEAALALRMTYNLTGQEIDRVEVTTFHESIRLATNAPKTTEEAQYSTSFPTAIALLHGGIKAQDLTGDALFDVDVLRLSRAIKMKEDDFCNQEFPLKRFAKVKLILKTGQELVSDWHQPKWDHTSPPSASEIAQKFHDLADPMLGRNWADQIEACVTSLENRPLSDLVSLVCKPIAQESE